MRAPRRLAVAIVVVALGLGVTRPATAAPPLPVVPDSRALLLRATHIALVEVTAATDDPPARATPYGPTTAIDVRLIDVLKGTFDGPRAATAHVVHAGPNAPTLSRLYGAWTYLELTPGTRFLVLSVSTSNALADVVNDPAAALVLAGDAATAAAGDVTRAREVHARPLADAFARARADAAALTWLYAHYLLAREHAPRDADGLAAVIEEPALAPEARGTLIISVDLWTGDDGPARDRIALALLRLLRLDGARALHDNLIGTWIPNLVGITGATSPRTAAQVFRGHARERALVRAALAAYRGSSPIRPLRDWLR